MLIDGEPVRSCVTRARPRPERSVTTLEGLRETGKPSKLQQAFIDEQAAQCGYCASGMIVAGAGAARPQSRTRPTAKSARRSTAISVAAASHNRIVRAVLRAAKEA